MYRPRAFEVNDAAVLHGFIRDRSFATVAVLRAGEAHFAYTPVVLDGEGLGRIRFHLATANPVCAAADGAPLLFSFLGEDAYISPDWYESAGRVPTWNYMAVEARGAAKKLTREDLRQLLVDLSADQEMRLLPKPPWQIGKVAEDRFEALLNAIDGFEVPLVSLEGKFKLSQSMSAADVAGTIAALEARGDARSVAVARAMRST